MASVEELRDIISTDLDKEERIRDESYSVSRDLVRECRKCISDLVQGIIPVETRLLETAEDLRKIIKGDRTPRFPFVEDSLVELAEESILRSILSTGDLPFPHDINVTNRAYILGACDVVGELRRIVLNNLLKGDLERALGIFESMKEVGRLVEGFSYPSGMIPLKKKQDVIRSLLDRTAGELTVAMSSRDRNMILGVEHHGN